jgi:hypothetical protein
MYPESNTLPEQHTPLLAAGLLIFIPACNKLDGECANES